ncbi:unnamed protein product [Leuciscus chuanchicus]
MRLNTEEKKMGFREQRLTDLERSSRHWRECRAKSIRICESMFPERGISLAHKTHTVHCIEGGSRIVHDLHPSLFSVLVYSSVTQILQTQEVCCEDINENSLNRRKAGCVICASRTKAERGVEAGFHVPGDDTIENLQIPFVENK